MSKVNELPKDLPPMERDIELDCEGNLTKTKYKGTFKFRIPNLKARAAADRKRAELNGNIPERFLDPGTAQLNYQIAYLRVNLIEVPEWWKKQDFGYDLFDSNVVDELYLKAIGFEEEWMKQVWGDSTKQEESDGKAQEGA